MSAYEGEELSEGLFSGFLFLRYLLTGKDQTSQRKTFAYIFTCQGIFY